MLIERRMNLPPVERDFRASHNSTRAIRQDVSSHLNLNKTAIHGRHKLIPIRSQCEYGTGCRTYHIFSNAAEHDVEQSCPTVGREYNQIHVGLTGIADNFNPRRSFSYGSNHCSTRRTTGVNKTLQAYFVAAVE